MNDFETEIDTAEPEVAESETDAAVVTSGLLPRDAYRPDARLEVVANSAEACAARRMYREIPIRIGDDRSVLLVGPWCEIRPGRAYRVRERDDRERILTDEPDSSTLLTVELVAKCDAETPLNRA